MTANPRRVLAAVLAAAVTCGVLAGCGTPAAPTVAPAPISPPAAAVTVVLPWPVLPAGAGELQQAVDGGSQPWLLDPQEVALAYVAAGYGWTTAQVVTSTDGTVADVTGPDGTGRTLTMAQPATTGPGGIWLVTADIPTP